MITTIIIPKERDRQITENSIKSFCNKIIYLNYGDTFNLLVNTCWKLFLYVGEYLSQELIESLPIILQQKQYDFFSLFLETEGKVFVSPRIFKSNIELKKDSLSPIDNNLSGMIILDGVIYAD